MSVERNTLTRSQAIDLYLFVKELHADLVQQQPSAERVAEMASSTLGFAVTFRNVEYLVETRQELAWLKPKEAAPVDVETLLKLVGDLEARIKRSEESHAARCAQLEEDIARLEARVTRLAGPQGELGLVA